MSDTTPNKYLVKFKELLTKILTNIKTLNDTIGSTDISSIGNGTVTGAISELNPTFSKVNADGITMQTSTATEVASVTVPSGTYIFIGSCRFSANATGVRSLFFCVDSVKSSSYDRFCYTRQNAVDGQLTIMQTCWMMKFNEEKTVYLVGYQNSGSALSITANGIEILRVG